MDLKTVHNWVKLGHLTGLRTRGGQLRFHRAEVIRFMRRCNYPIPARFGGVLPTVATIGIHDDEWSSDWTEGVRFERYERLFDAALAAASGAFEMIVVHLGRAELATAVDLARALRARPMTSTVAVVGISSSPIARESFVRQGGDAVVAGFQELTSVVALFAGLGDNDDADRGS